MTEGFSPTPEDEVPQDETTSPQEEGISPERELSELQRLWKTYLEETLMFLIPQPGEKAFEHIVLDPTVIEEYEINEVVEDGVELADLEYNSAETPIPNTLEESLALQDLVFQNFEIPDVQGPPIGYVVPGRSGDVPVHLYPIPHPDMEGMKMFLHVVHPGTESMNYIIGPKKKALSVLGGT